MQVSELYDSVADEYEELINSPKVNSQLLNNLKDIFLKYGINNGHILDSGCGPGNLKTTLGNNFSYTGIDVSAGMLSKAKEKGYITIHGKIEEKIKVIPDKSFDYVVSLSALHFVKNIKDVISKIERISKKGWLISLANVTETYSKQFSVSTIEPIYNHTNIVLDNITEDRFFEAWTSPSTGEKISERMIFRRF